MISGLFRNLLLGLVLTAMFHVMVTKPILAISKAVTRIDPDAPGGHLVEVPRGHDADELGLLVSRTNHFLNAFDASLTERARYADELRTALPDSRLLYFTTKVDRPYTAWEYQPDDCLVFGPETRGLPESVLDGNPENCLTIPMPNTNVRSLNLSTSVAIVLYEAIRQTTVEPA